MTDKKEYDKKKLIILRAALIVLGAAVGGAALWQYFIVYPDLVRNEFKIVITVVSAALAATLLALSAKPIYRLMSSVKEFVSGSASRLGVKGMIGVVLGLVAAVVFVLVIDVVMSLLQNIWAVRILVDALVYIVFAVLCCYGFTKWLSTPDMDDEAAVVATHKRGYLMSYKCLADARALTAASALINVYVLDSTYRALGLFMGDSDAVKRLDALVDDGSVKLVHVSGRFTAADELSDIERKYAEIKRLKYISTDDCDVRIDIFVNSELGIRNAELEEKNEFGIRNSECGIRGKE